MTKVNYVGFYSTGEKIEQGDLVEVPPGETAEILQINLKDPDAVDISSTIDKFVITVDRKNLVLLGPEEKLKDTKPLIDLLEQDILSIEEKLDLYDNENKQESLFTRRILRLRRHSYLNDLVSLVAFQKGTVNLYDKEFIHSRLNAVPSDYKEVLSEQVSSDISSIFGWHASQDDEIKEEISTNISSTNLSSIKEWLDLNQAILNLNIDSDSCYCASIRSKVYQFAFAKNFGKNYYEVSAVNKDVDLAIKEAQSEFVSKVELYKKTDQYWARFCDALTIAYGSKPTTGSGNWWNNALERAKASYFAICDKIENGLDPDDAITIEFFQEFFGRDGNLIFSILTNKENKIEQKVK